MVHDFLEWNISREDVLAMKEARSQAGKVGGKRSAAQRQARAQANASPSAQAKSKQNRTQSQSPIQSPRQSQKEIAPSGARKSIKDPRTDHPAIQAVKSITNKLPSKTIYDEVIETLGDQPDTEKLNNCFKTWVLRGYNPTNLTWLTEWYDRGIPVMGRNGNGKKEHSYRDEGWIPGAQGIEV